MLVNAKCQISRIDHKFRGPENGNIPFFIQNEILLEKGHSGMRI